MMMQEEKELLKDLSARLPQEEWRTKYERKKYVDNDVFKYRVSLKSNFTNEDITIYTKPFPDFPVGKYESDEQVQKFYDSQEDLVQEKYFTKERIQELKDYFCKLIQEDENPFYICCVDRDGGYNITEDMLFNIDNNK